MRAWIWAAAATAVLATGAVAQTPKRPTKQQIAVIDHRQAQMKQLGAAMKTLAAYAQGQSTDVAQMRRAAATLSRLGAAMPHLFPVGTAVGAGDSATRASLWKERDQFAARVAQFQTAAAGMNAAAATGRRAEVGQQLRAAGASCKACHDAWQVKD